MSNNGNNLLLLLYRPTEPIFVPKGDDNTVFEVPDNYLTERYRSIGTQLSNRFGESGPKIPVKNITIPNISLPLQLGRREIFSLFIPKHRRMAGKLIDIFMNMRDIDDLQSVAAYCRDRINPYMFNYCLSVALLHREDTKDLPLPNFLSTFPDKYMDSTVFSRLREEASVVPEGSRAPIPLPINYTASPQEPEQRVAYFREDLGINLHHWHWHLVYPFSASDRSIVAKDRRGELFYYMHQQIVARYNFERFCNNLNRVQRFNDLRQPMAEGYFPKLDSLVASRSWPPRFENTKLSDLNRSIDQIRLDIADVERWRNRFQSAIEQGFIVDSNNRQIPLNETTGIDYLGNMMEASIISPNPSFYGDIHNMGHVLISLSHDPDNKHLETFSVMGDSGTAMRDPMFYRWHAYLDDLFQLHKNTLPKYSTERLNFPGITVSGIRVDVTQGRPNVLETNWQQSDVNLARGMDFSPRGALFARFTHLQHKPFTYNITVNNSNNRQVRGTVRIFMAPKQDERGAPLSFVDQKHLMIELDKFTVNLTPGANNISRRSSESSVTIPFERTFRDISQRPAPGTPEESQFNFCGCGWPNHMLIPKGTAQGKEAQLFVMVSNYNDDRIEQDERGVCNDAPSYCGLKDKLYPDRRSMGYPFDRLPRDGVNTLAQFLTPNMRVQDVVIRFSDTTTLRAN